MTLLLEVDNNKFKTHQKSVLKDFPNLIPVIKGNGYGFGLENLVNEVKALNLATIAVGTVYEAQTIQNEFSGQILILEPYQGNDVEATKVLGQITANTIKTISAVNCGFNYKSDFVIEGRTSTNRFGLLKNEFALLDLKSPNLKGLALHLAINQSDDAKFNEVNEWLSFWQSVSENRDIWISHASKNLMNKLKEQNPDFNFLNRIGTELWLGDKSFITAKARVLAVVENVKNAGYSQKSLAANKKILVVSGGTANGIGLNSDKTIRSFLDRLKVFILGLSAAFGNSQSPFFINNKKTYFFEPAHMNVSLIKVAKNEKVSVGDYLIAKVRFSTTDFDSVKFLQ